MNFHECLIQRVGEPSVIEGTDPPPGKDGKCSWPPCHKSDSHPKFKLKVGCSSLRDGTSGSPCLNWVHGHKQCTGLKAEFLHKKNPKRLKWSCELFQGEGRAMVHRWADETTTTKGRKPGSSTVRKLEAKKINNTADSARNTGLQRTVIRQGLYRRGANGLHHPGNLEGEANEGVQHDEDGAKERSENDKAQGRCSHPQCKYPDLPLRSEDDEQVEPDVTAVRCNETALKRIRDHPDESLQQCANHTHRACATKWIKQGETWDCTKEGLEHAWPGAEIEAGGRGGDEDDGGDDGIGEGSQGGENDDDKEQQDDDEDMQMDEDLEDDVVDDAGKDQGSGEGDIFYLAQ